MSVQCQDTLHDFLNYFPPRFSAARIRSASRRAATRIASVTLQAVDSGNQPLLIQGGQFLAGANPISARWVNALFTVQ